MTEQKFHTLFEVAVLTAQFQTQLCASISVASKCFSAFPSYYISLQHHVKDLVTLVYIQEKNYQTRFSDRALWYRKRYFCDATAWLNLISHIRNLCFRIDIRRTAISRNNAINPAVVHACSVCLGCPKVTTRSISKKLSAFRDWHQGKLCK